MKASRILPLALLAAVFILSGCSTKQSAVNQLERYSYELRDNAQYYTVKEWKNAVDDFASIRKKIARHESEYTEQEKRRIGELEGKCASYMARGAKQRLVSGARNIASELNGIIEGIGRNIFY